jgi:hypothetical protein
MPHRYPARTSSGHPGEQVGRPQHQAQDGQADQRDHQQAAAEAQAGGDDHDGRDPHEQADPVMNEGEPGAR